MPCTCWERQAGGGQACVSLAGRDSPSPMASSGSGESWYCFGLFNIKETNKPASHADGRTAAGHAAQAPRAQLCFNEATHQ